MSNCLYCKKCPFCGSNKIGISIKRKECLSYSNHHVCCYCKDCNTYGPRLLVNDAEAKLGRGFYGERNLPEDLKKKAIELWNERS